MTVDKSLRGERAGLIVSLTILTCIVACVFGAPKALATYGDAYGLAPAEGPALPGPKSFWAGTCDLGAAPEAGDPIPGGVGIRPNQVVTGYSGFLEPVPDFAPAPALPEGCIDPGVAAASGSAVSPWVTPPSWRLPAVTQAGAHPDATAMFTMTRDFENQSGAAQLGAMPAGSTRDVSVVLPPGLSGNLGAIPECTNVEFEQNAATCPPQSQVGVANLKLNGTIAIVDTDKPVYRLEPVHGKTAEFGIPDVTLTSIRIVAKARTDGDFALATGVERVPTGVPLLQQSLTFWGVPWAASHDAFRLKTGTGERAVIPQSGLEPIEQASYQPSWGPIEPFISNPTSCDGRGPVTNFYADSWQNPGATLPDGEPDQSDPAWITAGSESPAVTGCGELGGHFKPGFELRPQSPFADSPSGYDADLSLPQNNDPPTGVADDPSESGAPAFWRSRAGLATSHLKDTTITLPPGVTVNPAAANGLAACSEEQIGFTTTKAHLQARSASTTINKPVQTRRGSERWKSKLRCSKKRFRDCLRRRPGSESVQLAAGALHGRRRPRARPDVKLAGKVTPDTGQRAADRELQ